jgi:hypothetical protein
LLATIPSNQTGEQQATVEGIPIEPNSPLFSPNELLSSTQQQHQQQQPLTINIAQQTRRYIYIVENYLSLFSYFSLAHSNMSDMSSPNHALDSPVSDDYSTVSTSVLDTNSIGGIAGGDGLPSNFKSNYQL